MNELNQIKNRIYKNDRDMPNLLAYLNALKEILNQRQFNDWVDEKNLVNKHIDSLKRLKKPANREATENQIRNIFDDLGFFLVQNCFWYRSNRITPDVIQLSSRPKKEMNIKDKSIIKPIYALDLSVYQAPLFVKGMQYRLSHQTVNFFHAKGLQILANTDHNSTTIGTKTSKEKIQQLPPPVTSDNYILIQLHELVKDILGQSYDKVTKAKYDIFLDEVLGTADNEFVFNDFQVTCTPKTMEPAKIQRLIGMYCSFLTK